MYTIKAYVDGTEYTLHDSRVKALTVGGKPYFEVGDNINGSASFSVYPNHPYYDKPFCGICGHAGGSEWNRPKHSKQLFHL